MEIIMAVLRLLLVVVAFTNMYGFRNQTSAMATGLNAGNYACNVTDNCGNVMIVTVTLVGSSLGMTADLEIHNVECAQGNTGSVYTTVTGGGTSLYTYSWSTGETKQNISNLAAGVYTLSVKDGGQCATVKKILITEPAAIEIVTNSKSDTCNQSVGVKAVNSKWWNTCLFIQLE